MVKTPTAKERKDIFPAGRLNPAVSRIGLRSIEFILPSNPFLETTENQTPEKTHRQ